MNPPSPLWSVAKPCDATAHWLEQRLSGAGLRFLRTFDLHDARLATADCPCPHHGTSACDCQMVVMLVYAESCPPVTLVLHGNHGQSWISVVDRADQRADPSALIAIQRALELQARSEA